MSGTMKNPSPPFVLSGDFATSIRVRRACRRTAEINTLR